MSVTPATTEEAHLLQHLQQQSLLSSGISQISPETGRVQRYGALTIEALPVTTTTLPTPAEPAPVEDPAVTQSKLHSALIGLMTTGGFQPPSNAQPIPPLQLVHQQQHPVSVSVIPQASVGDVIAPSSLSNLSSEAAIALSQLQQVWSLTNMNQV